MFTTYILFSPQYDKYYIGHTADLDYRMTMHNHDNPHSFTSKYRPWEVYTTLQFSSRSSAMKAERYIKKKPRDFIRRISTDKELRQFIINKFEDQ